MPQPITRLGALVSEGQRRLAATDRRRPSEADLEFNRRTAAGEKAEDVYADLASRNTAPKKKEPMGAEVQRTTVFAKRDKAPSADEPTPPPHPREFSAERPENPSRNVIENTRTYKGKLKRLEAYSKKPKPTTFGQLAGKVYTPDTDDRPTDLDYDEARATKFSGITSRGSMAVGDYESRPGARHGRTPSRDVNLPDESAERNAEAERDMRGGKGFYDESRTDVSPEARAQMRKMRKTRGRLLGSQRGA